MDGSKPQIKRVKIDVSREFIERSLDYNNLESGIEGIKEAITNLEKKPILKLEINNVDSDTGFVYDIIKEELGDLSLMIRPTFNMIGEDIEILKDITNSVGPEELIVDKLEGYGNSDVDKLAIELYRLLSKDRLEDSQTLIDQFFIDNYQSTKDEVEFKTEKIDNEDVEEEITEDENIDEESGDVQVTFKGALE